MPYLSRLHINTPGSGLVEDKATVAQYPFLFLRDATVARFPLLFISILRACEATAAHFALARSDSCAYPFDLPPDEYTTPPSSVFAF